MDRVPLGGMVAKIVSFGDSFILGNELDRVDGTLTWPGLIARDLNVDYETRAEAGCGNENIAQQIYNYFSKPAPGPILAVINWTWCMRWDFHLQDANLWVTLGPTCVPGKLEHLVGLERASELVSFYQAFTGRSDIWNRWRSLQTIYAAQCWLDRQGIQSVQTYMDPSMLVSKSEGDRLEHYRAYKDPAWLDVSSEEELRSLPSHVLDEVETDYQKHIMPEYVICLQNVVRPKLENFDGQTFLDWSRDRGYPITELLHPLQMAHKSAADFWHERYASLLDGSNGSK